MKKEVKMLSLEVVKVINDYRKMEGKSNELAHKSFMAKIRKELESLKSLGLDNGKNILPIEYKDERGRMKPCFELNRDGILQMTMSESTFVRYKVIEYINELEKEIEQDNKRRERSNDLVLAIINSKDETETAMAVKKYNEYKEKEKKELEERNKKLENKIDVITGIKGNFDLAQVSQIITDKGYKIGRNNLMKKLRNLEILKGNNTPYQRYIDSGYFEVIMKETFVGLKPVTLTTSKGINYIYKKIRE